VSSRGFVVGLTLALTTPLAAQQQPQPQAPTEGVDTQTRYQIRQYESALVQAVLHAGEQLAERADKIVPGVQLTLATDPIVRFVPTPEGPVFDVQIPLLLNTGPAILRWYQQQVRPASPAMPVAQDQGRVTAGGGVVTADPVTKSPVQDGSFDPDKEYTAFARQALIDALIDNSAAVPIKEGQRLEIAASGLGIMRDPLRPDNSRKLLLVISAADLTEFRQGKITRADVIARIKEDRY
jgi:hypothetical protein